MELETVKIVAPVSDENPLGYIVVNKDDLKDGDALFDDKPARGKKAAAADSDKPAE